MSRSGSNSEVRRRNREVRFAPNRRHEIKWANEEAAN